MINHADYYPETGWHSGRNPPADELEKVVAWTPLIGTRARGLWMRFARYIHGHGWMMREEYAVIIPNSDITWWMHIPPVPGQDV